MGILKKKKTVDIFPLSCNPELDKKSIPGIDTYYSDLKNIFKNSRIRNIAITGQHGVGKSSLIKSFDVTRRPIIKRKPKFLYISMGQYHQTKEEQNNYNPLTQHANIESIVDKSEECRISLDTLGSSSKCDPKKQQFDDKNAIERRILLQLCSKFKDYRFPASSFRMIPEKPGLFRSFGFIICFMSAILLLFKKPLAELLLNLTPNVEMVKSVLEFILKWHEYLELLLYIFVISGIIIFTWHFFQLIWVRGYNSSIGIKTSNVEWNLESNGSGDYLDQYTQELVYYLSCIGKKIDYTVVFEDMDRLDEDVCISIFVRLREINHILNANMKRKYIRFIFVIGDHIIDLLDYNKFFDFTLPVVPTLNQKSAEVIFSENLNKINASIEKKLIQQCKQEKDKALLGERSCGQCDYKNCSSVKCFYKKMEGDNAEIVQWVAGSLTDYRKMFTVLNEYSLAIRLYFSNNRKKLTCRTAEQILAFYVYKHMWPKDYQKLIANYMEASFLTGQPIGGDYEALFQKLYEEGLLNMDSLHSSGFSREKIASLWKKRLECGDIEKVIDAMIQVEGYKYPELQGLVENRCKVGFCPNNQLSDNVLAAAIQFILKARTNQTVQHSWFFKDRDSDVCIRVMATLTDVDVKKFIEPYKISDEWNVFQECSQIGGKLVHNNKWNEQMARVYALGVHPSKREVKSVILADKREIFFDAFDK